MERLIIRQEGTHPDIRVLVTCGGPGVRTVRTTGRASAEKSPKDVVKAVVAAARDLVASQRS
ncbi:MAG: hypothetical protein KAR39_12745 [Thermoplasmata archaeon]|nr:hypothetical protein [Thermoplasmata archaeon]